MRDLDPDDANRASYSDPTVVAHYVSKTELYPAEVELLTTCPPLSQLAVLDLGIGGGRTTHHLAPEARRYVGIDYIPAMVAAADEATGHQWDLRVGDATDLSAFGDGEFDLVVFSFNGLATLPTTRARLQCLHEVHRALRPGGHFLFSLGNPRFLKVPDEHPGGLTTRVRATLGYGQHLHRLAEPTFWRRHGWRTDVVLGDALHSYCAYPAHVARELTEVGFATPHTLSGLFPRDLAIVHTPWWYYLAPSDVR